MDSLITTGTIHGGKVTVDMDPEKIIKHYHSQNRQKVTHQGEEYYQYHNFALYFPNPRTAISGPEESVKKAIERGADVEDREELQFASVRYRQVSVIVAVDDHKISDEIILENLLIKQADDWEMGEIKGIATGSTLDYKGTGKVVTQIQFVNEDDAVEAKDHLKKRLAQMKEEWDTIGRKRFKAEQRIIIKKKRNYTIQDNRLDEIADAQEKSMNSMSIMISGQTVIMKANKYGVSTRLPAMFREVREKSDKTNFLLGMPRPYFGFGR
jgi:hypothetical protein